MQTTKRPHISVSKTIEQNLRDGIMVLLVFIAGLYFAGAENPLHAHPEPQGHICTWEDCDFTGATRFETDCEDGTDCYIFHLTHWLHPEWSYEEVEDYCFGWKGTEQDEVSDYN